MGGDGGGVCPYLARVRGSRSNRASEFGRGGHVFEKCEARQVLLQAWGSLESRKRSGSACCTRARGDLWPERGSVPGGASLGLRRDTTRPRLAATQTWEGETGECFLWTRMWDLGPREEAFMGDRAAFHAWTPGVRAPVHRWGAVEKSPQQTVCPALPHQGQGWVFPGGRGGSQPDTG